MWGRKVQGKIRQIYATKNTRNVRLLKLRIPGKETVSTLPLFLYEAVRRCRRGGNTGKKIQGSSATKNTQKHKTVNNEIFRKRKYRKASFIPKRGTHGGVKVMRSKGKDD